MHDRVVLAVALVAALVGGCSAIVDSELSHHPPPDYVLPPVTGGVSPVPVGGPSNTAASMAGTGGGVGGMMAATGTGGAMTATVPTGGTSLAPTPPDPTPDAGIGGDDAGTDDDAG